MTVLIDSCAWIEYFQGSQLGKKVDAYVRSDEEILVSTLNITEIYSYFLQTKSQKANAFIEFIFEKSFPIPVDTEIALHAAEYKKEKILGIADAIVLATAEKENAKILTGDNDFKGFPNVIFLES
ncbi:type II toxin-antitoxin system VapC family toxin [Candidatus Woesearchaeota archaeon]|nr:type II toxin-antitoxin system VapC family toxin [Candidatus Woesearchaeota archaeon]